MISIFQRSKRTTIICLDLRFKKSWGVPKKCKALIIPWQFKRGFVVGAGKVEEVGSESERTKDLTRTFIFFRTIIRIHLNEKGMKGKLS